jgi:hypothetical protein
MLSTDLNCKIAFQLHCTPSLSWKAHFDHLSLAGRLCLERFQMEFVEEGYFKCCREGFLLILSELISTLQVTSTTVYLSYIIV